MEKFVVDLDKVLDDFEKNEGEKLCVGDFYSDSSSGYNSLKTSVEFSQPHFTSLSPTQAVTSISEDPDNTTIVYEEKTPTTEKIIFEDFATAHSTQKQGPISDFDSPCSLIFNNCKETDLVNDKDNVTETIYQLSFTDSDNYDNPSTSPNVIESYSASTPTKADEMKSSNVAIVIDDQGNASSGKVRENLSLNYSANIPSFDNVGEPQSSPHKSALPGPDQDARNQTTVNRKNSLTFLNSNLSHVYPTQAPTTPTEDIGFACVPGIPGPAAETFSQSKLAPPVCETNSRFSRVEQANLPHDGNQFPPKKKARPNSLLGLSIPTPPSELVKKDEQLKCTDVNYSKPSNLTLQIPEPNYSSPTVNQPSPKPPFSPINSYEEIENPLHRETRQLESLISKDDTSLPPTSDVSSSVSPSKSTKRPSFLPIPSQQPSTNDSFNNPQDSEDNPISFQSSADSILETEVLHTVDTADSEAALPTLTDGISGDSPTASISSSASSAWSGIADEDIGKREPQWARDDSSPSCMSCNTRFTVLRRRHHCRACGKLLCGQCCSWKSKLEFIKNAKMVRVCAKCYQQLVRLDSSNARLAASGITPLQQPNQKSSPQTPNSALKRQRTSQCSAAGANGSGGAGGGYVSKSVMFSDGIRPGGDLLESSGPFVATPTRPQDAANNSLRSYSDSFVKDSRMGSFESFDESLECLIPCGDLSGKMPPLVIQYCQELILQMDPPVDLITQQLNNSDAPPVVLALNRNLHVLVKKLILDCCVYQRCWCFTSRGLEKIGQEEVVILLECQEEENLPPLDIFRHYYQLYEEVRSVSTPDKKSPFKEFSYLLSPSGLFNNKELAGFLYIRPTFQCLQKLVLPHGSFLIGLLIQRWEAPWAKLFPLRLLLRLGIEARYYPCPLISTRSRGPVFAELGHTVLQLLADFRDYKYTLPVLPGLCIHLSSRECKLILPRWSYQKLMKIMNERPDDSVVLAFGSVLSGEADSHLVCVQKEEEGSYVTQAISIENTDRKVTGTSFVIFNGGQRQTMWRIVEDGVIVQLRENQLKELVNKMKSCEPVTFTCDKTGEAEDVISVVWVDESVAASSVAMIRSWIDNRPIHSTSASMDSSSNILRIPPSHQLIHWQRASQLLPNATPKLHPSLRLVWTGLYTLCYPAECEDSSTGEPVDIDRLGNEIAGSFITALIPHLGILREQDLIHLALRVVLDPEQVCFEAACRNSDDQISLPLPNVCLNDLDNSLVPTLHPRAAHIRNGPLLLELIFHILD